MQRKSSNLAKLAGAIVILLPGFSTESPFRGALRAINFKSFNIYSNSTQRSDDGFCTDTYGNYLPAATLVGNICSEGIYQRITNTFNGNSNMWNWINPATQINGQVIGALRIYGQGVRYPNTELSDNPQRPFIEGLRQPDANGLGCPRGAVSLPAGASQVDKAYCPTGIGFERIIDHRDSVSQQVKDKVAVNPVTGEQYNTDLHASN
ncbi:MAG: hypothetical protein AB8B97_02170 [Granulosicoccus sp.]